MDETIVVDNDQTECGAGGSIAHFFPIQRLFRRLISGFLVKN
jgi:hypothetical protein